MTLKVLIKMAPEESVFLNFKFTMGENMRLDKKPEPR